MPDATTNSHQMMTSMQTVDGPSLRTWRVAHGLSQEQLASMLDVPMNTVARWERGEVAIRHPRIVALALQALGFSMLVSATMNEAV